MQQGPTTGAFSATTLNEGRSVSSGDTPEIRCCPLLFSVAHEGRSVSSATHVYKALNEGRSVSSGDTIACRRGFEGNSLNEGRSVSSGDTLKRRWKRNKPLYAQRRPER